MIQPFPLTGPRRGLKFAAHTEKAFLGRPCIYLSGSDVREQDEMPKREHTIIFVPHARARFRQFRVSSGLLWGLGAAFLTSGLLGVTFSALWVRSINKHREVTAILAENSDLRTRATLTNARLESLEKQLAEFEDRTRRLSIVAGLSAVRDPGMGGVGGLTAAPIDPSASADSPFMTARARTRCATRRTCRTVTWPTSRKAAATSATTCVPSAGRRSSPPATAR